MCTRRHTTTHVHTDAHARTPSDCNQENAVTALIISFLCIILTAYCNSKSKFDYASIELLLPNPALEVEFASTDEMNNTTS